MYFFKTSAPVFINGYLACQNDTRMGYPYLNHRFLTRANRGKKRHLGEKIHRQRYKADRACSKVLPRTKKWGKERSHRRGDKPALVKRDRCNRRYDSSEIFRNYRGNKALLMTDRRKWTRNESYQKK